MSGLHILMRLLQNEVDDLIVKKTLGERSRTLISEPSATNMHDLFMEDRFFQEEREMIENVVFGD